MAKIFISYRRDDTAWVSGLIHERLVRHFGAGAVFTDIDSIPLGVDFRKYIDEKVGGCDIFLAVIGDKWLSVTGSSGQPRIHEADDFVRIEIESALNRDIPVVPVLVDGLPMPSPDDLPETLRELAFRNGTPMRPQPTLDSDMGRLVAGIEAHITRSDKVASQVATEVEAVAAEPEPKPELEPEAAKPKPCMSAELEMKDAIFRQDLEAVQNCLQHDLDLARVDQEGFSLRDYARMRGGPIWKLLKNRKSG